MVSLAYETSICLEDNEHKRSKFYFMNLSCGQQRNTLHLNNGIERQVQHCNTSTRLFGLPFSKAHTSKLGATTHRFDVPEVSDINFIHGQEICIVFQIHVQLQDLAEIRTRGFQDRRDVLQGLSLCTRPVSGRSGKVRTRWCPYRLSLDPSFNELPSVLVQANISRDESEDCGSQLPLLGYHEGERASWFRKSGLIITTLVGVILATVIFQPPTPPMCIHIRGPSLSRKLSLLTPCHFL